MFLYNENNHPLNYSLFNDEVYNESQILIDECSNLLLNEAYYGKNKQLEEVERILSTIVKKITYDKYLNPTFSKENKQIEKIFADLFNFEAVEITWKPTLSHIDMNTMPVGNIFLASYSNYDLVKNNSGIKFKSSNGKICKICICNSLITKLHLDAGELLACLLHEIGHNFFISKNMFYFRKIVLMIPSLVLPLITTQAGRRFVHRLRENSIMQKIINNSNKFTSLFKDFTIILNQLTLPANLTSLPNIIQTMEIDKVMFNLFLRNYKEERFADNFATMYGYGAELSSAMKKFDTTNEVNHISYFLDDYDVLATIYNSTSFIIYNILNIGDCQPNNYERVYDQARMLEKELERETNPVIRRELTNDLKQIQKIYKEMASDDYLIANHEEFKMIFYNLTGVPGRDRRTLKEKLLGYKNNDYNYKELNR